MRMDPIRVRAIRARCACALCVRAMRVCTRVVCVRVRPRRVCVRVHHMNMHTHYTHAHTYYMHTRMHCRTALHPPHSTARHLTVHCTIQHCIVLHCTALHSTALLCMAPHHTICIHSSRQQARPPQTAATRLTHPPCPCLPASQPRALPHPRPPWSPLCLPDSPLGLP